MVIGGCFSVLFDRPVSEPDVQVSKHPALQWFIPVFVVVVVYPHG